MQTAERAGDLELERGWFSFQPLFCYSSSTLLITSCIHNTKLLWALNSIFSITVLAFCACCNRLPQTREVKQQKFILSQFWRPQILNQDVGRASIPLKAQRENPSLLLPASCGARHSLAYGCINLISASIYTGFFLFLCVFSSSVICKDTLLNSIIINISVRSLELVLLDFIR